MCITLCDMVLFVFWHRDECLVCHGGVGGGGGGVRLCSLQMGVWYRTIGVYLGIGQSTVCVLPSLISKTSNGVID